MGVSHNFKVGIFKKYFLNLPVVFFPMKAQNDKASHNMTIAFMKDFSLSSLLKQREDF